jgi:HAMP domain-containing protein/predicted regulator of Ras-like GTPase activity (Roadblock/LC7/MglB family)
LSNKSKKTKDNFLEKYPLISWLAIFFCFLFFPAFILEVSLTNLISLKVENHKKHQFSELNNQLDYLDKYSDSKRYFHLLFKKIFELASKQKNPAKFLEIQIRNLKKQYPNCLTFIVWNGKGRLNRKLTDEKKYKYVLKKLWQVLNKVRLSLELNPNEEIAELLEVQKNLNFVKTFLGRIFIPKLLSAPYKANRQGNIILSDFGEQRPYFWYHLNDKIGFLTFLNWEILKNERGLKKIIASLNNRGQKMKFGYVKIPDFMTPYPELKGIINAELAIALGKFENSSDSNIEGATNLFSFRSLGPKLRGYAYLEKEDEIYSISTRKWKFLFRLAAVYFIVLMLLYFILIVRKVFISIRWKLVFLFLYANTIPLIILFFISYDYLQHKKTSLKNNIQIESNRLLKEFDRRYTLLQDKYASELKSIFDHQNKTLKSQLFNPATIKILDEKLQNYASTERYIIASSGKVIISKAGRNEKVKHSIATIKDFCKSILEFVNTPQSNKKQKHNFKRVMSAEGSDFIRGSFKNSQKMWPINFGSQINLGYWNMIGDRANYQSNYIALMIWRIEEFQKLYMKEFCLDMSNNKLGLTILGQDTLTRKAYPESTPHGTALKDFFTKTIDRKNHFSEAINFNNETYLATGLIGKNLSNIAIAALYPTHKIQKQINELTISLILAGLISLSLTILIGITLAHQFIRPIHALNEAAVEIGKRNFRHRIPEKDKDEFGHLNNVFNRAIEGLGELEIARIVQESLFPDSHFNEKNYKVFGKSAVMTTLGGDYFDFIDLNEESFAIVMGDVAGHGVPAGLIMAMAKSAVKMATEEQKTDPAELIKAVHSVIYGIKNKKLKRMMTFQYLVIDKNSGKINFSNAGHCFPLLINKDNESAEFIEQVGAPIGVVKRCRCTNKEIAIKPGEAIILYTDGIIESKNKSGEMIGFNNLKSIALKAYHQDPEIFYKNIYNQYIDWAGKPDDDTTIIVILRENQSDEY